MTLNLRTFILPCMITGIALTMSACLNTSESNLNSVAANSATEFARFKNRFLDSLWKHNPDWASSQGYHKYDSVLVIPSNDERRNEYDFIGTQKASLNKFDPKNLTPLDQIDYRLIQNQLMYSRWHLDSLKAYRWDPSGYNVTGSFAFILTENYKPLKARLTSLYQKMANIPAYYEEAKKQIIHPVPELLSLAIEQNQGGLEVFTNDFPDSLKKSSFTQTEQAAMNGRAKASATAITSFISWLKAYKNEQPRSFRLGKDLYAQKYNYEIQSAYSAPEIYQAAEKRKAYLHKQLFDLCTRLWPKYFANTSKPQDSLETIRKIIDTVSARHVQPQDFQAAISKILPQLSSFVRSHNLLYLDPNKPLVVRKEPGYMAGVAGASCSSPGPYDKQGNTYFNVGSLSGWTPQRAESYLREYNSYLLQILCIHEAIPGHYTQLVYANKAPSLIKSVFGNGAMIEGWAVYTEQMMLESGFGNNEPEMWLMWYKWNLRSVCNTILDYSVHACAMTKEEAVQFLTKEAFQQQAEAEGKWKRVSVTSVQLTSYFTGFKEITDLREAYKKQQGKHYSVKKFNEQFLSYGSAPVKYIKVMMIKAEN